MSDYVDHGGWTGEATPTTHALCVAVTTDGLRQFVGHRALERLVDQASSAGPDDYMWALKFLEATMLAKASNDDSAFASMELPAECEPPLFTRFVTVAAAAIALDGLARTGGFSDIDGGDTLHSTAIGLVRLLVDCGSIAHMLLLDDMETRGDEPVIVVTNAEVGMFAGNWAAAGSRAFLEGGEDLMDCNDTARFWIFDLLYPPDRPQAVSYEAAMASAITFSAVADLTAMAYLVPIAAAITSVCDDAANEALEAMMVD